MLLSIALAAGLAVDQPRQPRALRSTPVARPRQPTGPKPAEIPERTQPAEPETPFSRMAAAAVRVPPPLPRDDSPDQVRRMASSDRDETRYFSRVGATREAYEREWQQCRQMARRLASSRSSGSWMSAGFTHGGIAGGLIFGGMDAAFSERRARRDIRRYCMVVRGWRMIEPDAAGRQRIAALSRDERDAYLDRMLAAEQTEAGATVTDASNMSASMFADKADGAAAAPDPDDE